MTNPTYDFSGQVALVTGAASGMGLAAARGFAESGTAVALLDRDAGEAAENFDRVNAVNLLIGLTKSGAVAYAPRGTGSTPSAWAASPTCGVRVARPAWR